MNKKVIIIGGSGFLGSHLADTLLDSNYTVTIFDNKKSLWLKPGQKMIVGDILDKDAVFSSIKGNQYVYHLAGIADIGQAAATPRETVEHNIIGSTNVLDACVEAKVNRFFFASTIYVYSRQGSFYRVSKQAVESLIEAYYERFGLEYTILRYGSLYGPRAQQWNGLQRYVTQAVKEGKIIYNGTGEERREYIHVKDAVKLSVDAIDANFINRCYTLTGTQVFSSRELLHMINEIMGGNIILEIKAENKNPDHYDFTPYRYTPKEALKIVPNTFVDIGQGILDLVEGVYQSETISS